MRIIILLKIVHIKNILLAIKYNIDALNYASNNLQNNKEFILSCIQQNGYALKNLY